MQKINSKGFSAIAIIIIILAIVLLGGGAYYYFTSRNVSVINTQTNPNNLTVNSTSNNGTLSENACDYLTQGVLSQYLTNKYKLANIQVSHACSYDGQLSNNNSVAFLIMDLGMQVSQSLIDSNYQGDIARGYKEINGIGDKAWWLPPAIPEVTLHFVKNRRFYIITLDDGPSAQDNIIKAENIAKEIVQKLP